ncbi:hypothetical protein BU24DRAFT_466203 [Aaosphaeria arxii CBS 175.79]|uniref:Rhodopsin domain-containing protein n=1 Tax=Aaosphaeria arxii CBS 175.79 TaxID=1450172 RepID=A0A6A5XEZ9_9PLEO|nr:uncharacterized protein BU24DRAFT_466203 [Aaosphaeria arxii CBS 175.79]KAF2011503.1 hypothetical protein BU24DRAFT_466203 [Aaosphaeria arxii CBS 175.79]
MYGLSSHGKSQFDANVAWAVLVGVAVATRLYCKVKSKQDIKSDDYWVIAALLFYYVAVGFAIWGVITGGGGLEMENHGLVKDKPQKRRHVVQLSPAWTFVLTSIYCVKISILLFYRRIFFITTGYKQVSLALMVLSTAWYIASQVANLLTCQPVDSFWNRRKPGKCSNFNAMYLGTGTVDLLIDVAILVLPIRMAFNLHLPTRTKVAVAGIFSLGGFVVISQIVRLVYVYQPGARYVKFYESEQWTNIHDATAIICACLPIYKPVWSPVSKFVGKVVSHYTSLLKSKITGRKSKSSVNSSRMERLDSSEMNRESKSVGGDSTHELRTVSEFGQDDSRGAKGLEADDATYHVVRKGSTAYSRRMDMV